jgi:hypothetical protein
MMALSSPHTSEAFYAVENNVKISSKTGKRSLARQKSY